LVMSGLNSLLRLKLQSSCLRSKIVPNSCENNSLQLTMLFQFRPILKTAVLSSRYLRFLMCVHMKE
jgi:hypothetical protein